MYRPSTATGSGELKCQHSSAVWWKKAMTGVSLIHSCALKGTVLTMSMTTSNWPFRSPGTSVVRLGRPSAVRRDGPRGSRRRSPRSAGREQWRRRGSPRGRRRPSGGRPARCTPRRRRRRNGRGRARSGRGCAWGAPWFGGSGVGGGRQAARRRSDRPGSSRRGADGADPVGVGGVAAGQDGQGVRQRPQDGLLGDRRAGHALLSERAASQVAVAGGHRRDEELEVEGEPGLAHARQQVGHHVAPDDLAAGLRVVHSE